MFGAGKSGGVTTPTDPQFNYVTMLLHGDGTNGAQNNTFVDSSSNAFSITRNGNTTQGSYSPYGSLWSNYFDGNGDNITTPSSAALALGSGDFTIEGWVNPQSKVKSFPSIFGNTVGFGSNFVALQFDHNSAASKFRFWVYNANSGSPLLESPSTYAYGAWYHVAVTRSGSTFRMFINGTQVVSATYSGAIDGGSSQVARVGSNASSDDDFAGNVSNFRIIKGTAVYTGNFTPSTTPLTAITNTQLLTCQSNRFIDTSANNFAITRNGDVRVTNFAPFAPTAAYSTATNGGSGYFDGSGDYLTVPANAAWNLGSGAFTLECWSYPTAAQSDKHLFSLNSSGGTGYWVLRYDTGTVPQFIFNNYGSSLTSSTAATVSQWNHIVMVSNGTTMSLYLNGTRVATTSAIAINDGSANALYIGSQINQVRDISGYLSGARLVKGSAVYDPTQSTLTVPTAPPTAITNTSLLLNFTNGAIFDNAMMVDLETVGNAQISTSVVKFGTGSYYIGATSGANYLQIPKTPQTIFGTGDFTVEGWFLPSASGDERTFYLHGLNTTGGLSFFVGTGGARFRANGTTDLVASMTISNSNFTHIAFVRSGNTRRIFVNGTQQASDTLSFNVSDDVVTDIGASAQNSSDAFRYYGYIDDLRITKGFARYTANFSVPTAAFPNQ